MNQIFRIIDVNRNRVCEATRVIEDYARFVLEDVELYQRIRSIRHSFIKTLSASFHNLLSARDIENDFGRKTPSNKKELPEVIISNFHRISEALRSIAEYLKIQFPSLAPLEANKSNNSKPLLCFNQPSGTLLTGLAPKIEKLRFDTYQLEQKFFFILYPNQLFNKVRLYVLVPDKINTLSVEKIIPDLIKGGVDAIQLRAEKTPDKELLKLAIRLRKITRVHKVLFIINNRIDIAFLSNADGVHLGGTDCSVREARRILGADKIIGATTHSLKEAMNAEKNGADYISVGPFFDSPTKPFLKPRGFDYLEDIAKKIHIPYIAIGGINKDNLPVLLKAHKKLFKYPLKIAISSGILSPERRTLELPTDSATGKNAKDIYKVTKQITRIIQKLW